MVAAYFIIRPDNKSWIAFLFLHRIEWGHSIGIGWLGGMDPTFKLFSQNDGQAGHPEDGIVIITTMMMRMMMMMMMTMMMMMMMTMITLVIALMRARQPESKLVSSPCSAITCQSSIIVVIMMAVMIIIIVVIMMMTMMIMIMMLLVIYLVFKDSRYQTTHSSTTLDMVILLSTLAGVDRPPQLIWQIIFSFGYLYLSIDKYKRHSMAICFSEW